MEYSIPGYCDLSPTFTPLSFSMLALSFQRTEKQNKQTYDSSKMKGNVPPIQLWNHDSSSWWSSIPSVSPYAFLGLSTFTVGTSFRDIYCDMLHLLWFACPNQCFACPTKAFHPCTTAQGTLFSAWDMTIKNDCASQHSEFWGAETYRGCIGKNGDVSDHWSLCVILNSNVQFH
jgi:hypothetical protein